MAQLEVRAEGHVGAPAASVYRFIANFRDHHHRFLPPAFSQFRVERGGIGAGTVATFRVTLGGVSQDYRTEVQEPEPGRVLTETDAHVGSFTTFTVTPEDGGSRVRIVTTWPSKGGVRGLFERLIAPRMIRKLYNDELTLLDRYARSQTAADQQ